MFNKDDFKYYAAIRIAAGIVALLVIFWLFSLVFGSSEKNLEDFSKTEKTKVNDIKTQHENTFPLQDDITEKGSDNAGSPDEEEAVYVKESPENIKKEVSHEKDSPDHEKSEHANQLYKIRGEARHDVIGWTFVESTVAPLSYELYERFLGWRVNDILVGRFTDNINNFQKGVLEVTRRTAVKLAEDISRTGSTESFNQNLENAMNWLMIKPETFWFPSAESKYKAAMSGIRNYQELLIKNEARFYNRTDNLIPLLKTYRNLLGSCDDNLIKKFEDNGDEVSFFDADDYFFYTLGVAKSMSHILKAIEHDFEIVLSSRNTMDTLKHAIHSLDEAEEIDPLIILNSDLNGFFANHRANLATKISHARFYIGVLIVTLST
ncbi:MAG: DUF2333 family protein [Desulforegulaceae bacterium]|nr:DUF2333 family protein [Desulforegulaceae bacterium]